MGCPSTHDARRVITDSTIVELADELWMADRKAAPIQPLTARYPDLAIEDAYAIQSHNIDRRIAMGSHVIGRKVGLSTTPCWRRIQRLEESGVIARRVALADPEKIGFGLSVFVEIETGDHSDGWLGRFIPR